MNSYKELMCLLTTLGLLSVLVGANTLDKARQLRCADNLRQLKQILDIYENEHGALPPVTIPMKPRWKFWTNCLRPYADSALYFACPADSRNAYMYEEDGSPLFSYKTQKSASYGMNWFLNEKEAKRANAAQARLACLSKPEQIVLFADSKGPYLLPERFWQHEMDLRHQEQANFAFADGHVELLKQEHFGSYDDKGQFRSDFSKWHWQ